MKHNYLSVVEIYRHGCTCTHVYISLVNLIKKFILNDICMIKPFEAIMIKLSSIDFSDVKSIEHRLKLTKLVIKINTLLKELSSLTSLNLNYLSQYFRYLNNLIKSKKKLNIYSTWLVIYTEIVYNKLLIFRKSFIRIGSNSVLLNNHFADKLEILIYLIFLWRVECTYDSLIDKFLINTLNSISHQINYIDMNTDLASFSHLEDAVDYLSIILNKLPNELIDEFSVIMNVRHIKYLMINYSDQHENI